MDSRFANQDSNDQNFRDMFNIPDKEAEAKFGLLGNIVVLALMLTAPMALIAGINHLIG